MTHSNFINRGAEIMVLKRPDVWSEAEAKEFLIESLMRLASSEDTSVSSGGFKVSKFIDDGNIEYELTQHLLDLNVYEPPEESYVFEWTHHN